MPRPTSAVPASYPTFAEHTCERRAFLKGLLGSLALLGAGSAFADPISPFDASPPEPSPGDQTRTEWIPEEGFLSWEGDEGGRFEYRLKLVLAASAPSLPKVAVQEAALAVLHDAFERASCGGLTLEDLRADLTAAILKAGGLDQAALYDLDLEIRDCVDLALAGCSASGGERVSGVGGFALMAAFIVGFRGLSRRRAIADIQS